MSATIIILPIVPVIHADEAIPRTLRLTRRQDARLQRYAREWNLSPEETAAIIDQYFQSVRQR